MTGTMRVLHFVGFVAWLGGGLGAMVAGIVLRRLDRSLWGGVADVQAALYRILIGPGSMLTVVSGFALTMQHYGTMSLSVGPWLGMMQLCGICGAIATLLGAMPAAMRLGRLEPTGPTAAAFDVARGRLIRFGIIGGVFSTLALLAGALYRVA